MGEFGAIFVAAPCLHRLSLSLTHTLLSRYIFVTII